MDKLAHAWWYLFRKYNDAGVNLGVSKKDINDALGILWECKDKCK